MDNEKLIKQLSEEGKKVPDNRKKIISRAKAEGLLKNNVHSARHVYNGGGSAAAVKSNRIIAAVASVFVLGTVATAAIVPFVAGNNSGIPPVPPLGPTLCTEELGTDYAVGAVSTAKLLGCFGIGGVEENGGATAKPASMKREAFVGQEIDMETRINNFGTYMGAFGAFYGAGEELISVRESSVADSKYPNSIVIAGKYANGDDAEFAMYYLEALDAEYTGEGDKYYLEGKIIIDGIGYYLEGSRIFPDAGGEAYDLVLQAYPDEKNRGDYVQMTMGVTSDNPLGRSYDYKVFKNNKWLTQTLTYLPSFNENEAFNLILGYGAGNDVFTVERPVAGEPILRVGYETKDGKRSSFKVSQTRGEAVCIMMRNFIYDVNESDKTCRIKGYKAAEEYKDETLDIPEEIIFKNDIYRVTEVGNSAFFRREEIKKVIFPASVKRINNNAFSYCTGIESVEFNEGLETIGSYAFEYCEPLKTISIPASVTSINHNAFYGCKGLESISVASGNTNYSGAGNCLVDKSGSLIQGCASSVIPQDGSVKWISSNAFRSTKIKSVNIPSSVSIIGDRAFEFCEELEEVVVSDNKMLIEEQAFGYCVKLAKITLPDNNLELHENIFYETAYKNDKSNWDIENGYEALYIGKHLIYLNATKRYDGYAADAVVKPGTLTIANKAFAFDEYNIGLYTLNSITLNKELLRIGYASHIGGAGCGSIAFDGWNAEYYVEGNCLIERVYGRIIAGCETSIIPTNKNIIGIEDYAFAGCLFSNIVIPDNIEYIGNFAFASCHYLQEIIIPNSVRTINQNAFWNCSSLSKVVFEELTDDSEQHGLMLWNCFSSCQELTSITLPKHANDLRSIAYYCDNLVSIDITFNETLGLEIRDLVYSCPNMKTVTFHGTMEQWKKSYYGDIDFMPFNVICSDGMLQPDYHM